MNILRFFVRHFSSNKPITPQVCIVGAGPAGFYAAQHLTKRVSSAKIDIYEKLPVPFGLVRFGVAPDHPEVKNVINTFSKTAEHPNIKFIGNVALGKDVRLQDLREAYHAVLLTYGADQDRRLNISGENLNNSLSARDIVGWYNGIPWNANLKIDLSGETVAIFGQGNVAIDVARILLSPVEKLKATDITDHALQALAASKVKEVHLLGRRGPLQAAFTIKELREMLKLEDCSTCWNAEDFKGVEEIVPSLARPKKRITELMLKSTKETSQGNKFFKPRFFRSPLEIFGTDRVTGVKLGITGLEGSDILTQRALLTNKTEDLNCNMCITSIGYKSRQVDADIPFDVEIGVAKNVNGKIENGLYAAGWLATGPTGVILSTMSNAFAVADTVVNDIENNNILDKNRSGFDFISEILQKHAVQVVTWNDWLEIDKYEQEEGKKIGKPRTKILDISKMLDIVG